CVVGGGMGARQEDVGRRATESESHPRGGRTRRGRATNRVRQDRAASHHGTGDGVDGGRRSLPLERAVRVPGRRLRGRGLPPRKNREPDPRLEAPGFRQGDGSPGGPGDREVSGMSRPIEDTGRRAYLVNLEWKPLAILVAISSAFVAVTIASLFVLGLAAIPIAIVLVDSFLLFFVVWIGIYGIVEYALWRSTRNPGHRLQYLGVALILLPLSYSYIMLFLGGISATFSLFGFITTAVGGVSFIAGLGVRLAGC